MSFLRCTGYCISNLTLFQWSRKLRFQVVAANSKTHRRTLHFYHMNDEDRRSPILTRERITKNHVASYATKRNVTLNRFLDHEIYNLGISFAFFIQYLFLPLLIHGIRSVSNSNYRTIQGFVLTGHRTESTINWMCKKRFN